jgi:hypothetical protein
LSVGIQQKFRRNISPSSSGLKNKPRRTFYLLHPDFLLGVFFDPEDGGDIFLQHFF